MPIEYTDRGVLHKEQFIDREDALSAGGVVRKDEKIWTNTILELVMGSKIAIIVESFGVLGILGSVEPIDLVTLTDLAVAGLDVTKSPLDTATLGLTGTLGVGFGFGRFGELGFGGNNTI